MKLYKVKVCGTKREYFIVDSSADSAVSIAYSYEITDGSSITNFEADAVNLDDHRGLTLVRKEMR